MQLPPPQAFQKLGRRKFQEGENGGKQKGMPTNFPRWLKPQAKLLYHYQINIIIKN
jgi:hypothetical protein